MPRPPLPAPVASQCLPALSQPRALSAGGFPGWKLSSITPAKAGPIIPAPASTTQQPSLASKSGHHVTQHAHHPALPCGLLPAAASSAGEQAGMQQLTSFFTPTAKAMAAKPKEVGRSAALAAASPAVATAARPAGWGQGRASSSPGGAAKRVQAVQQGAATGQRVAPVGASSHPAPDQQPGAEQPDTQRPLQPAEGLLAIPGLPPAARAHSGSSPACPDKDATTAACHASLPSHTSQPAVFSHSGGGGDIADMEPKHGSCAGGGGREAIQDACSPETVQAAAEEPVEREEGGASHDPFFTQTQV
ncbi:hypothetical protein QJQ45_001683 [Haematococcus lacustris]|nr:hypothetical protein QJQ45_001683 [Haematococcus lacustris]